MIKRILWISVILVLALQVNAQRFSGGFKAGYNITFIDAPKLTNQAGDELESFSTGNGFHVGAILNFEVNDYFGLRTNLLYTQRGAITNFDSEDTYLILRSTDGTSDFARGAKDMNISVNNSYLEIPLLIYGKYKNFEIAAGPSFGLLVTSGATGSINFDGDWRREEVSVQSGINHKYYSNTAASFNINEAYSFNSGFDTRYFPFSHTGYYEFDEKDGSLYKVINVGLTAEVNYFFNRGLFFGLGYYYGLNDVTRSAMDLDWNSLDDDNNIQTRDDDDKLSSLRISVGFRF